MSASGENTGASAIALVSIFFMWYRSHWQHAHALVASFLCAYFSRTLHAHTLACPSLFTISEHPPFLGVHFEGA